jgi:putative tricarboxylic transport membrane protein
VVERLLALAVLVASVVYMAQAWALPLGGPARPGPGFYPLAVGAFGAVVAVAWAVVAMRGGRTAVPTPIPTPIPGAMDGRARVGIAAGLLVAFCLLLPWTGYPVVAFPFVALLLRGLGSRWGTALAIGAVSALGSFYLFGELLGVPLPRGVLLGG